MSDFHKVAGRWLNLDHITHIEPDADGPNDALWLRFALTSDYERVMGDDARALLSKLRNDPGEVEVREKSGAGYTLATSTLTDAQKQAQELTQMLGGGKGRTFDFQDSTGQSRRGTVYREDEGWRAEVDGNYYPDKPSRPASSEAGAMSAAMGAA